LTITLDDLQSFIKHVLSGGGRLSTSLPGSDADAVEKGIVNHAGRWFTSHHPWNWRIAPEVQISTVASQDYVDLPVDFGEMVAYQVISGLNYGIELTTPQIIADRRASSVTISQNYYWGTISHPRRPDSKSPPPAPRLELWPTPSTAVVDFMRLWYRTKWVELDETTDAADVPDYCEFALAMTCRAFASGLSEEYGNERDVTGELNKLVNGPIFQACKETDGMQQTDYGHLAGGAIQGQYSPSWRSASASPVADPA
jgi:hypothetical protein